jgi:hypothetical protein
LATVQGEGVKGVKSIEARIKALEKLAVAFEICSASIPGTSLVRSLLPSSLGMGWCLSIGGLNTPKLHFYERGIPGAVKAAERYFAVRLGADERARKARKAIKR